MATPSFEGLPCPPTTSPGHRSWTPSCRSSASSGNCWAPGSARSWPCRTSSSTSGHAAGPAACPLVEELVLHGQDRALPGAQQFPLEALDLQEGVHERCPGEVVGGHGNPSNEGVAIRI